MDLTDLVLGSLNERYRNHDGNFLREGMCHGIACLAFEIWYYGSSSSKGVALKSIFSKLEQKKFALADYTQEEKETMRDIGRYQRPYHFFEKQGILLSQRRILEEKLSSFEDLSKKVFLVAVRNEGFFFFLDLFLEALASFHGAFCWLVGTRRFCYKKRRKLMGFLFPRRSSRKCRNICYQDKSYTAFQ